MKQVDVLICAVRTQQLIHQCDVLLVKMSALLGVVDLQSPKGSHHVCCLGSVGPLSHHGRNHCLEVGADGNECVAIVLHRNV